MARWRADGLKSAKHKAAVAGEKLSAEKSRVGLSKKASATLARRRDDLKVLRSHQPRVHFGTVASGSLVVASKTLQARLLTLHGKILGTEMESAGMMAQTFTHEMPTPAIVVKGISDHADPKKAAADGVGYWRELACENSIRFVLTMLGRGRVKPLHTDEFLLDSTCGPIEETRSLIGEAAAPGIAIRGFPRLVCPRGPITKICIDVEAFADDGSALRIHKLVIVHVPRSSENGVERNYPPGKTVLMEQLAPEPIQVHLMLAGTAHTIKFSVRTPDRAGTAQWQKTDPEA